MNNDITIDPEEIRSMKDGSISDPEMIRQIALYAIKSGDDTLNDKIKLGYEICGLYPHVINLIQPEEKAYVSGYCEGEKCFCGKDAKHKISEVLFEDDPNPLRHELTSYVCCDHFQMVMGNYAKLLCNRNKH